MAGPRGERARRPGARAGGRAWLRGGGGPGGAALPGGRAGRDRRAAGGGEVDARGARRRPRACRCSTRTSTRAALGGRRGRRRSRRGAPSCAAALAAGRGAVAVTTALRHGHRLGLTKAAAAAGVAGASAAARRRRRGVPRRPGGAGRRADPGRPVRAPAARVGGVPPRARDAADPRRSPRSRSWTARPRTGSAGSSLPSTRASAVVRTRSVREPQSRRGDSNPWPTLYKSVALPTELLRPARTSLGPRRARRYRRAMKRAHPTTPLWVKLTIAAPRWRSALAWWIAGPARPARQRAAAGRDRLADRRARRARSAAPGRSGGCSAGTSSRAACASAPTARPHDETKIRKHVVRRARRARRGAPRRRSSSASPAPGSPAGATGARP